MAKPKLKQKDPRSICMKDRNGTTLDVIVTDWMQFQKDVIMHDIQFPVFVGLVTDMITMAVYVIMCDYKDKEKLYGVKIADVKKEEKKNDIR